MAAGLAGDGARIMVAKRQWTVVAAATDGAVMGREGRGEREKREREWENLGENLSPL